jgi:hypothetical protein
MQHAILGPLIIRKPRPQPKATVPTLIRRGTVAIPKTALELARPFPLGLLASQVCPYATTPATVRRNAVQLLPEG